MNLPHVLVVGAPGSGKSAMCSLIREALRGNGVTMPSFSIDDILRELVPRGLEDGTYYYDSTDALVLIRPELYVPRALQIFAERCVYESGRKGFLAEVSHHQPQEVILLLRNTDALTGIIVIHLWASRLRRLMRNATRGELRAPERIVSEYPSSMSGYLSPTVYKAGGLYLSVSNDADDLKQLEASALVVSQLILARSRIL